MRFNRRSTSLVAAAMGALILAPIQPPIASAALKATATNDTLSISTGSMAIFAEDTYTATNPFSPLTMYSNNGHATFFFIKNTGTFGVSRFTITLGLPAGTQVTNFRRCAINVYFSAHDVCASGSYSAITITANNATAITLNLPPNSFYAFQIRQNKNTYLTVNVSANTAFINTSGVTNS